jgi:hypothetical protein
MGGGTFDLLKTGPYWPESAKQLKISLAGMSKIVSIYSDVKDQSWLAVALTAPYR